MLITRRSGVVEYPKEHLQRYKSLGLLWPAIWAICHYNLSAAHDDERAGAPNRQGSLVSAGGCTV
jgi:hypothetical protein